MRQMLLAAAIAAATVVAAPLVLAPLIVAPGVAQAQGTTQTVQLTKVDVVKVATGFRVSKVIGSSVVNDAGDTVGKVDDVIIGEGGKEPFVVLAVGGFLGIGDKLVVLPYEQLKTMDRKIVMPGATKEALKDLPTFKYASD
jgi:sporulation protein YlmC with PRC-barrel domain